MKQIPLTQGKFALVDDEDYEFLNQWKWCYQIPGYAVRGIKKNGKTKIMIMHRVILKASRGTVLDHINGNGLDNRRSNLRICTQQQNTRNSHKRRTSISSKHKGVHYSTKDQRWVTQIQQGGKRVHIGHFKSEHHAALAYDLWAHDLFDNFARPNFQKAT